jgi:signal peptidase II
MTFEREHEMSLANNSRDLLQQVQRALGPARHRHLRPVRGLRQPDPQGAPAGVPAGHAVRGVQAARGATLSPDQPTEHGVPDQPDAPRGPAALPPRRRGLLLAVAPSCCCSTWSPRCSWWPSSRAGGPSSCSGGRAVPVVSRNSGAAFSMGQGATLLFTTVAIVVVTVVLRISGRARSTGWALALGLLLGGASGNLVDRLFRSPGPGRGAVVDWIALGWFPSFNVADSGIVVGGMLAVLLSFRGIELDGGRAGRDQPPA